ncbi:hypothetical protein ACHHYP_07271 [Achlya hypogyna]|uniref:TRAF-type domain-containing protein n=1 Tax=Achlya hypogyna TaxID=1202772 RepID=A0A1V9YRA4_ACHHY|nr:hypothetical protein ACHHYP_07271 [Achlya hypogyna]
MGGKYVVRSKLQSRFELALARRDFQLVVWMMDSGDVAVNAEAANGDTALLVAVARNQIDVLDLLLARGVDVNHVNCHGKTALMRAAATTDVDTTDAVNILLRHRADVFATDPSGKTALDWARVTNNVPVARRLELAIQSHIVAHRVIHANQEAAAKHDAIAAAHAALAQQMTGLLEAYDAPALRRLVMSSDVSLDVYTSIFGASPPYFVNLETRLGWTALTKAASLGDLDTMTVLLTHGAAVDYETKLRHTALSWASYSGHKEAVQLLLRYNADVLRPTREKKTALSHACRNGKAAVTSILLSKIRELSIPPTSQGDYVTQKNREWHKGYLNHLCAKDAEDKTPLDHARGGGHTEVIALLEAAFDLAHEHEQHVQTLEAKTRAVPCAHGCGFTNAQDLIVYHQLNKCPMREVTCELCKEHMASQHLGDHQRKTCVYRDTTCVNLQFGCSATLPWQAMQLHEAEHCHYRLVHCRLECGKELQWHSRPDHEANDCPLRPITCPACGLGMRGLELKKHKKRGCPKRLVECQLHGGCGEIHVAEDTAFHIDSLCVRRKRPCHWAIHGCDAVIGPPEVRLVHEETTCPYRIVACRNGCGVTNLLFAFLDQHLTWDCPLEMKSCSLGCGARMEAQYLFGHEEPHCGLCPRRTTRCPLDLCGKKICFFGAATLLESAEVCTQRSDVAAPNTSITREGILARAARLETFAARELGAFALANAQPYLLNWLQERRVAQLAASAALGLDRVDLAMVVTYNPETALHYVSLKGRVLWVDLNRVYHVLDPAGSVADWVCPPMPAADRGAHVMDVCMLRSVNCPNACGQRCPKFQLDHHLKERCCKRMVVCRLTCHKAMPMEALMAHEETECPKSQRFCPHCHTPCLFEDLESHVRHACMQFPRNCRLTCGAQVPRASFAEHEATTCPKRLVLCSRCTQRVFACDLPSHAADECSHRPFGLCENKCGMDLLVHQVADHLLNECPHRSVACPQCPSAIPFSIFDHHIKFDCPRRELFCHKGCGARVRDCDMAAHDAFDCAHRPAMCALKCGTELAMSQMQRHMQIECPQRLVPCPNRCGTQVHAVQVPGHLRSCDHRMVLCGAGGKQCARPLKAWIVSGKLDRCYKHRTHGFMWALKCGDVEVVLGFLNKLQPSELDVEFDTGYSPLVLACAKGDATLVRILLEHGADVNKETSRGRTPLGEACMGRHQHLVALLLEYRAVVSHTNRHGLATLTIAEQMNDAELLNALTQRQQLEDMQRRLFVAIGASDYDEIQALVAGGEMSYRDSHAWHLARELEASRAVLAAARVELAQHVEDMNMTIADTEAKQMRVVRLLDSMEYNKGQLAHVQKKETQLEAVRVHTESAVRNIVRKITAQDIINIISRPNPPEDLIVVLKAMALFQGIIPKPKRLSSDANSFSSREWWETAQAMLMDRGFLRRLLDIRELAIEPDVLFKVRRECLKHDAFQDLGTADLTPPEHGTLMPPVIAKHRHGRRNAITNSTVDALGTWVKGVEMNQKARHEAKLLKERRESVVAEIEQLDHDLAAATFDMKTAHRSLPSRQEELDRIIALEQRAAADFRLKQRRVVVCDLLAFTSLNGHTPLSYAAAIGNERAVRILLSRGANGGHSDVERAMAARLLQSVVHLYVEQGLHAPADRELFRIIRYMAMRPLVKALRRCRQTQRVPLFEAAYNGHTDVVPLLIDVGGAPPWQCSYIEPVAAMPGQLHWGQPPNTDIGMNVWRLVLPRTPFALTNACALGRERFACTQFVDGRGWVAESRYDATTAEVAVVLEASAKRQAASRLEQFNRKAVLRKTRHMKKLHDQLDAAIVGKDYVAASALLDAGAFPDHATAAGMTILMQAASEERFITNIDNDCVLVVEFLLDRKTGRPSPNFVSTTPDGSFSHTALSVAAHYGTTMCGRMLVDRGADVNVRDSVFGQTALMHAIQSNKEDFVKFLLEHKAHVHVKDAAGRSAFSFALERRNEKMLGLLSEASADMHQTLEIHNYLAAYGLCRWGCGFVGLHAAPVVEAGEGLVASMRNPLQEHELHTCPKRVVPCPLDCGKKDLWGEEVAAHLSSECPHRPLPCTNPKCDAIVAASALSQHMHTECPHRTVGCPLCGESSLAHKLDVHLGACRLRLVPCPQCACTLRALDVTNHIKYECDCREVRCLLGCGFVRFKDRATHEANDCSKRSIACLFECPEGTTPETQAAHEQLCENRPLGCPNHCGASVRACDIDNHLAECKNRFRPCPLACGRQVRDIDSDDHVARDCLKREVSCELCGSALPANLLDFHVKQDCACRILACGMCGDCGIRAKDMQVHKVSSCRMREVTCAFAGDGCMKHSLLAHEKAQHENFECKYRTIWCPLGCQAYIIARHLKTHEAACPMRFSVCSLGCGAEMREKDRVEHETFYCIYNKNK